MTERERPSSVLAILIGIVLILYAVILLAQAGCGDNLHPPARLLDGPDPDAETDAAPLEDSGLGCCRFYPDATAIGACEAQSLPPCTCGVAACQRPASDGGGFLKVGVCAGPTSDAGSCFGDAGTDGAP